MPRFRPTTDYYLQPINPEGSMPQDWRDNAPVQKWIQNTGFKLQTTSQVVKILERILSDHIWDLLHKNDFVSCDQHSFRAGCSCVTQLLECVHDWTGNFDKKKSPLI